MSNYRRLRATFSFLELPDSQYMSIEALEDELTVSFSQNTIYYSIDLTKTWTALSPNTTTPAINTGDRIYFKAEGLTPNYSYGIGTFTINKRCKACGNVMSLANGNLSNYLFYELFGNCTTLVEVSSNFLPATKLASNCYRYMFKGCTSLVNVPKLPATTLASSCYENMFYECTSLVTAPELPATTLATTCYANMFSYCTSLTIAPQLPATTLSNYCYRDMFSYCTSLTSAPELPATSLASDCYRNMFYNCTSLVNVPKLPATTLASGCYQYMFSKCTSLTNVPQLPATTLSNYCYHGMFQECTSLIVTPELPATTLALNCYCYMFYNCTSLTTAPELHATTLTDSCYQNMFSYCTLLTTAPELPATTLVVDCYSYMFKGCTSLTTAPELHATTLADNCYESMFSDCTSLTTAPELPATTLTDECYNSMFKGCSNLNFIYAKFTTTPSSSYTNNWVVGVASSGTFVKNYEATWDVAGPNGIPSGWTVTNDIILDSCTDLYINADDVRGKATTTTIHYSATCTATTYKGDSIVITLTGTTTSEEFPQNTSTTDTVERTITYEFMGQTATTTITQGVWADRFYSLDLNSLWRSSAITNPDSSLYDGVYESFSNIGIDKSAAVAYITINGYTNFSFYIRSDAESNFDYVMVSQLDLTITYDTSYSRPALVKAYTRGNQQSGTELSNYTLVEFTDIDGGEHTITVLYRKDGSSAKGSDQGYLLIPKNQ